MGHLKKTFSQINGIVHPPPPPKKEILSFTHDYVIPNPYDLFLWNTKKTFSPFNASQWVLVFFWTSTFLKKKYILLVLVALHLNPLCIMHYKVYI